MNTFCACGCYQGSFVEGWDFLPSKTLRFPPIIQSEVSLWRKIHGWKNNHNQNTSKASHRMASHQLNAEAISIVRQQMAPWSMQEKNRKQEMLDDWLTFPVHAVAVDLEAVVLMVSCACGECGELPDGCPRFHPTGRANRAELQYLAGSPKRFMQQFKEEEFDYEKKHLQMWRKKNNQNVQQTCPSRPILTGLCSFQGLDRWAVLVKGSSLLEKNTNYPYSVWEKNNKKTSGILISMNLHSQSILNTPPSIFAFMPAGRTQWIGDPPWLDSDDKRAKPTRATEESR